MKKLILSGLILFSLAGAAFSAELTAKEISQQAARKANVDESILYLKNQVSRVSDPTQKRALYIFMASLQEQMAFYSDAQISYAQAASIAAPDAEGFPKKSNEQLVLDAVRCALSAGDSDTADTYLNSAVRNSKNARIRAYIKLYTQWSKLCRADTADDLQEPVLILQSYLKSEAMTYVYPAVLLTLWYLTGEKAYGVEIQGKFPGSMEAAVVNGDAQLLPTPFWFFVPKKGEAEQGTGTYAAVEIPKDSGNDDANGAISLPGVGGAASQAGDAASASASSTAGSPSAAAASSGEKASCKLQVGFFGSKKNAEGLCEELKKKNFSPYITTETRSSGTTYYLVLINDPDGNLADKLRSNGYECYVVE